MGHGVDDEFTRFVRDRGKALAHTAFLLTGDASRAEDLVQSALLAVWLRRRKVQPDGWEGYARRTMVNTSTSWWRRRSSWERPVAVLVDRPAPGGTSAVDERDRLLSALRQLGARQRVAVVLRHYEDLSEAETARLMGCSLGTVKSLTSRGLGRLRDLLTQPEAGTGAEPETGADPAVATVGRRAPVRTRLPVTPDLPSTVYRRPGDR
ncbi:SigE family RNA polymerase sigma factor [Frankia sp. R82]|uniref:SigE family RNA polymerase sigma factor n=1 Tax=Frankia sp. R82 TaxID=2950553 RepID=UPI002042EADD|nr:SigE family RNA polymerase sigma factor [Frankia sp. R82]MCM3887331.1 SigE family RNA polymerase sigma factor [Frankia sp. R82]